MVQQAGTDDAPQGGVALFDPEARVDPYPGYRRQRETAPILRLPGGVWALARHADCSQMLRDPRFGHPTPQDTSPNFLFGRPESVPDSLRDADGAPVLSFIVRNPPDHTRIRGLVAKAFTPRMVARLAPRIERVVDELLDAALAAERDLAAAADGDASGGIDLIATLAYPLPVTIISELLGVPATDSDRFRQWSSDLARSLDPAFLLPPDVRERHLTARAEFAEYFRGMAALRRRDPADDLLSALVAVEERGDALTEQELLATCILLLIAGHETTVNLLGNGTLALLRNPEALARFRADPSVAANAVEELLRYDSPVQLTGRVALTDADLGGQPVAKGEIALALIGAANRDPAAHADPDRLDLDREATRHLAFGQGIHFCLGAPLARLEGRIALGRLLERAPRLRLAGEPVWRDNVVLRGLSRLPVRFT
jgi:cytochrome P450